MTNLPVGQSLCPASLDDDPSLQAAPLNLYSDNFLLNLALYAPVFLFALSVHECAHAITARWGGDTLPDEQGRVTLNPLSHIDPIGTVLMPILGMLSGIPLLMWAKPVESRPNSFRRGPRYHSIVAFAGPLSNLLLALISSLLFGCLNLVAIQFAATIQGSESLEKIMAVVVNLLSYSVIVNLGLACFNMLPFPPLDGHHIVRDYVISPNPALRPAWEFFCQYGPYLLLFGIIFGFLQPLLRFVLYPLAHLVFAFGELPFLLG